MRQAMASRTANEPMQAASQMAHAVSIRRCMVTPRPWEGAERREAGAYTVSARGGKAGRGGAWPGLARLGLAGRGRHGAAWYGGARPG